MSDEQGNNVRRFGRKNQKDRLTKPNSLFPIEDEQATVSEVKIDAEKQPNTSEFDMDKLNLPDTDSEALSMLSALRDEVKAPIITPQGERYPPLAPTAPPTRRRTRTTQNPKPKVSPIRAFLYNSASLLLLIVSVLTLVWFGFIWVNPQSMMNPFPPATPFVFATVLPDANAELSTLATPDADGQVFVVITDTPAPILESTPSLFPFVSEPVTYVPNTNELGCNWWSIAGTVTDLDSNPITGYRVQIIGDNLEETVFSGVSQAFGAGGFELPLMGTPQEAQFTLQLLSPQDMPLSEEIEVLTQTDCNANVAVINFIQNR